MDKEGIWEDPEAVKSNERMHGKVLQDNTVLPMLKYARLTYRMVVRSRELDKACEVEARSNLVLLES